MRGGFRVTFRDASVNSRARAVHGPGRGAVVADPVVARNFCETETNPVAPETARGVCCVGGVEFVRPRRGAPAVVRVPGEHHRFSRRGGGRASTATRGVV